MKKLFLAGSLLVMNIVYSQPFTFTEYILNPGLAGSGPGDFHLVAAKLVFAATDTTHGRELWCTDGTSSGTLMLKDITFGKYNSNCQEFERVNNKLYFMASDSAIGYELWVTDGTAPGTMLVKDINPGKPHSYPQEKISYNGNLIFIAQDTVVGSELWISDGTSAGTKVLKDINPGKNGSNPNNFIQFNNKIYFQATDTGGLDLWCTDGTLNGTQKAKGILTGNAIHLVKATMGKLFMTQGTAAYGNEVWVTDGTDTGTHLLQDMVPGANFGVSLVYTIEYGGRLLILATTPFAVGRSYLYITDGTFAGTRLLKSFNYLPGNATIPDFCKFDNKVYFGATDGNGLTSKSTLWVTDGTAIGTEQVKSTYSNGVISNPATFVVYNNYLYLTATPGGGGSRLLVRTDGTDTGTITVSPPGSHLNPLGPGTELIVYDSALYFQALYAGSAGKELWSLKDLSTRKLPAYKSVFGNAFTQHTGTHKGLSINAIVYGIKGDTVVNGVQFKKVSNTWNNGDGFGAPLGLLREDTITGKVWYRSISQPSKPNYTYPNRDTIEKLVMDMNLLPGDTFIVGNNFFSGDTVIVDTVYRLNNRKHIEFNTSIPFDYSANSYKFSFIEGLGTSFGLCYKDSNTIHPMSSPTYNGRAICFYKDSVHQYTMPIAQDLSGNCMPPAGINDKLTLNTTSIYPNPNSGLFTIKLPNVPAQVMITDISGRVIYKAETEKVNVLNIDFSNQPKGIYLVRITTGQATSYGKIMLQ